MLMLKVPFYNPSSISLFHSHHASLPCSLLPILTHPRPIRNIEPQPLRIQIHLITPILQNARNVLRVLKLPQIDVAAALLDRVTDELGGAGLTLRAHDHGLLFLPGLVDDKGGALRFLLRDLLGFDGGGEFGREGEVLSYALVLDCVGGAALGGMGMAYRQRNIIKQDIKPRRPPNQIVPHQPADILSLRNQLTRIELRHHALQHLVHNTRQHPLIVVGAQCAIDLGQRIHPRPRQHTAGDVDHLQVLGAGEGGDVAGFGAHVVGDGRLEPGDAEVGALGVDVFADAADAGVFDCAVASVDWDLLLVMWRGREGMVEGGEV